MSFLVEIFGLAGAGKSSLAQRLVEVCPRARLNLPLPRRFTHPTFLLTQPGLWLPSWLDQRGRGRWFSWNDSRAMAYTQAWLEALQLPGSEQTTVIFDHGPLFRLARVDAFKGRRMDSERFEVWWKHHLHAWLAALDLVVWLDAPEDLLVARVRERSELTQEQVSRAEMHQFYRRYRESFNRILEARGSDESPQLLQFDTSRQSADEIAERVCEQLPRAGRFSKSSTLG